MTKRKSLSKKLRFEVFKRDKFTCQYCGKKAPDVVLNADHIQPVKEGGTNDILNLITSCESCNQGKGARLLSDDQVISKQHAELSALQDRREQIEMLLEWRESLVDIEQDEIELLVSAIVSKHDPLTVSDGGKKDLKTWLKRFSVKELLNAIDGSFNTYFKPDFSDENSINKAWNNAFRKILIVAKSIKSGVDYESQKENYYVRGILRRRLDYVDESTVMSWLADAIEAGATPETLKDFAKKIETWDEFLRGVRYFITNSGDKDG